MEKEEDKINLNNINTSDYSDYNLMILPIVKEDILNNMLQIMSKTKLNLKAISERLKIADNSILNLYIYGSRLWYYNIY